MKRFMQICGLLFWFLVVVYCNIRNLYGIWLLPWNASGRCVALFQSTIEAFACFVAIFGAHSSLGRNTVTLIGQFYWSE